MSEGNSTAAPGTGWYVFTSSSTIAAIPAMKSSGDSSPRSTSPSRCSQSAVSRGDCRTSGRTVTRELPAWVGSRLVIFLAFFRSTSPVDTSFSRIAARVAGVPMPFRSASSGISPAPAVSIL